MFNNISNSLAHYKIFNQPALANKDFHMQVCQPCSLRESDYQQFI